MKQTFKIVLVLVAIIIGYYTYSFIKEETTDYGHKVVICIPVYGQSLALGEEAVRITDFDSLRIKYNGRIVTECLDYGFGYIDDSVKKQRLKKFLHYRKRSFELSSYAMSESLASQLGEDTMICIFPGGRGMSGIDSINKPNPVYNKFLYEVKYAYEKSQERGWKFYIPAICWMQGESDIIDYTNTNYKRALKQFCTDVNKDIKAITKQKEDIHMICYQSNVLTRAEHFNANNYNCIETKTPQAIVDLIREDTLFWASGPTYPYTFVNEKLHIDAIGQQHMGYLDAIVVMNLLKGKGKTYGLTPRSISAVGNDILIHMNVPSPPMVFDTISIMPIDHYGFSVITENNENIISGIQIEGDIVRLTCTRSPINCKVRYAINGERMKSGHLHGPRGNLRDSQGDKISINVTNKKYPLHNWCYQFDMLCQ
jgi:hypothetical protein